jgi:hypothetical protein
MAFWVRHQRKGQFHCHLPQAAHHPIGSSAGTTRCSIPGPLFAVTLAAGTTGWSKFRSSEFMCRSLHCSTRRSVSESWMRKRNRSRRQVEDLAHFAEHLFPLHSEGHDVRAPHQLAGFLFADMPVLVEGHDRVDCDSQAIYAVEPLTRGFRDRTRRCTANCRGAGCF